MSIQHSSSCHPGALMRKQRTWPPTNTPMPKEPPRFVRTIEWEPRAWQRTVGVRTDAFRR